jgi:hypothetical protein
MGTAAQTWFMDQFATPNAITAIVDNDDEEALHDVDEYVVFNLLPGETDQLELGGTARTYRTPGVAQATIVVREGTGAQRTREIADLIRLAFRRKSTGGVQFEVPYAGPGTRVGDRYRTPVTIPFHADDVAA